VTRDSFKQVAQQALEQVTQAAERELGRSFPRTFRFSWLGSKEDLVAEGDVAEFLTEMTFVDETHIWPCFDLHLVRLLADGSLLLVGYRARIGIILPIRVLATVQGGLAHSSWVANILWRN
jgi:hypothetical protein